MPLFTKELGGISLAIYRHLQTSFWQDPFVLDLTPEEKFFYIYLMTNTKTTQCGVYEISKRVIEMETGYTKDTIDKLIVRFQEYQKIKYDTKTNELIILNWFKHNFSRSPSVINCIKKEIDAIKSKIFRECANHLLKHYTENDDDKKDVKETEKSESVDTVTIE